MNSLPSGTVTFLFTDIEGSTKLAQQYPDAMPVLLTRHHEILRQCIQAQNGYIFQNEGDSLAVAFHSPLDALNTAIQAQRLLQSEAWTPAPIKVRIGIHTGEAKLNDTSAPTVYTGYTTLATTARIMSAGHGGQILLSGAARELVRDTLPANTELIDLGEKHLKDLLRPEHLYQLNIADLVITFPPLKTLDSFPNNLPIQLTSFIGRKTEIAEVKQELEQHRLVTLTGSGGTGKTRLSLKVAAELLEKFDHGVWFVELAPLTDPDLIPQTILSAIGIQEQQGKTPLDVLKEYLHEKQTLIVLDNCEHLISVSAKVTNDLLNAAPKLKILASSREALGVKGEASYPVPSLSLPDDKHLPTIEQLSQYEAVQLFIDRALLVAPYFILDTDNAPFIAQICYRLDGIPLALELAAARVKMLSVEQISKRLDDRFRLLTGGSRTSLPRQQTLRALIDWSYNLLADQEKILFRRLAVFVGGWTIESAESVCVGEGIESGDVLDLLGHLVDKSLIMVANDGKVPRYRRLETIRQYAREKLHETEEVTVVRDRHLDYFRVLAEKAELEILNINQLMWLELLHHEFDNIRAALEWSQEKRVEDGLQLGSSIWRFCLRYGYTIELSEKLSKLLQYPEAAKRTIARAKALYTLSILAVWQNDYVSLRSWSEESYDIYKELDDPKGMAAGLYVLGLPANRGDTTSLSFLLKSLALYRAMKDRTDICDVLIVISQVSEDIVQRQVCLKEALALARERGDIITTAGALDNLGNLATDLGDYPQARSYFEESLELQRPLGAAGYITTLYYFGNLEMNTGNLIQARAYLEETLTIGKKTGTTTTWQYLFSLANLGYIALREGDLAEAKETFKLSIQQFQKTKSQNGMVYVVEGLASLHVRQRRFERATQLFVWTDAMREKIGDHRPPVEQASVDKDLASIRSQLREDEFASLSANGRTMSVEQAIALALEE